MDNTKREESDSDLSDDWNVVGEKDCQVTVSESESIEVIADDRDGEEAESESDSLREQHDCHQDVGSEAITTDKKEEDDNGSVFPEECRIMSRLGQDLSGAVLVVEENGREYSTIELVLTISAVILCAITTSYTNGFGTGFGFTDGLMGFEHIGEEFHTGLMNQLAIYKERNDALQNKMDHLTKAVLAVKEKTLGLQALFELVEEVQSNEWVATAGGSEESVVNVYGPAENELKEMRGGLEKLEINSGVKRMLREADEAERDLQRLVGRVEKLKRDVVGQKVPVDSEERRVDEGGVVKKNEWQRKKMKYKGKRDEEKRKKKESGWKVDEDMKDVGRKRRKDSVISEDVRKDIKHGEAEKKRKRWNEGEGKGGKRKGRAEEDRQKKFVKKARVEEGKNEEVNKLKADILSDVKGYVEQVVRELTGKKSENGTDSNNSEEAWTFRRAQNRDTLRGSEPCPRGSPCPPGGFEDPFSRVETLYTRSRWAVRQKSAVCRYHPDQPHCHINR